MTQTGSETAVDPTRNETDAPASDAGTPRYERSEISFPYSSLQDAEAVATAVHGWGGNDVSPARIAATLDTTVKSSGFRTDVAAARLFGFVDGRGSLSLTPLGHRLVDAEKAPQARVEAFKQVPLFDALYEQHQGKVLPGPKGIEAEMLRLGVSPKQVSRARQLFQRSAHHAGFFNTSPERLVEPMTGAASGAGGKKIGDGEEKPKLVTGDPSILPPEVAVLIQRLLLDGEDWSDEAVKAYLASTRTFYKAIAGR